MVDIHWRVTVFQLHWVCPHSRCVCFRGLHFSGSRLLCWELSEAGPGLFALPILSRSGLGSQVSHKWMESHTNMVGGVGWAASLPGHLNTAGAPGSKDTQHHVGGMLVRLPCYSKCGFRISSISWKTVRNTEPQALPDHLNQNPTLNNMHRCFLCTFKFKSHCLRRWLDPSR